MITPTHKELPKMNHNTSGKFECQFTAVNIGSSSSIMLTGLEGSTLGIWAAHGEGKFHLPMDESQYQIPGNTIKPPTLLIQTVLITMLPCCAVMTEDTWS